MTRGTLELTRDDARQLREAEERWAKAKGHRAADRGRCLNWLSKGRCGGCREGCLDRHQWMDHTTAWIDKEGKRLLLCQPYRIDDIGSLADACVRHGLRAFVHSTSWYGHGTVAIELRPREVTSDG